MSMFENDNYEINYQRYLDWKNQQAEQEVEEEWERRQCEERIMDEWNEFIADIDRLKRHEEEEKEKTTGEKIVEDAWKQEENEKDCGCSYFDGACDHGPRPHGIDGTQCDCSDCTFNYGYCSCGCAGDSNKHAEWVEEQEQSFVHETVEPPAPEKEEEKEVSESNVTRDRRFCEDLKIATTTGLIAVFFGMYLGRYTCC
jgi:hypothetical protein